MESNIIDNKVEELLALAKVEGYNNLQILLLGYRGSKAIDQDGLLAAHVQDFIRETLIPNVRRGKELIIALNN